MIIPLNSAARLPEANPQPANLLAVASGKGGVGKTWFSITLAHALSRAGKRALLFDGDLGLANVDVQLGIAPNRDLGSFLAGQNTLADTATRYEPGQFDVIAGRSGAGNLAQLPPSRLLALRTDLTALSSKYDYVIMDMGAGIDRTVRSFAGEARTAIVVTTDEPTAITDAYAFIKVTTQDRPDLDIRIVVNMVNSTREGDQTYNVLLRACREFLKFEPGLAGIIRRDSHVREAIRKQTALITRFPNCDAADDVQAIATRLINK